MSERVRTIFGLSRASLAAVTMLVPVPLVVEPTVHTDGVVDVIVPGVRPPTVPALVGVSDAVATNDGAVWLPPAGLKRSPGPTITR